MSNFLNDMRQAFSSRICWTVAAATFSAIILVEIFILIPSVNSFAEDWRERRSNEVLIALENRLMSDPEALDMDKITYHLNELVTMQTIKYWQIVGASTQYAGGKFNDRSNQVSLPQQDWLANNVIVGLDSQQLYVEKNAYILRISGLIAIIAIFTTAATLIVLFYTVLRPVIELHYQIRRAKEDGHNYSYKVDIKAQRNELGLVISEFNSMLERIQKSFEKAQLDGLTKLPNRNIGLEYLHKAVDQAKRFNRTLAVMFIDLDNFKTVNDQLGHDAGDELLVRASNRISTSVRDSDITVLGTTKSSIVSRIGGDEFMVVLGEIAVQENAGDVARRIIKSLEQPFVLSRERVQHVGASVGIALYPNNGATPNELLISADTALYESKNRGRGHFQFFSEEMNRNLARRMKIESELRSATEKSRFEVHYQPVIDVQSKKTVGVEALIRWHHPELGWVSPEEFISIAESIGLINTIGSWVTTRACRDVAALREQGYDLRLAVNVSSKQFRHGDFITTIRNIIKTTSFPADCLELEITERLFIDNQQQAKDVIKALSADGIHFSLDDFGTGYSSLSYLRQFKVHTLKIDKTFVFGIDTDQQDATLTKTIIAMAHALDMRVVAEGVEMASHHEFLQQHDCEYAQGYWYGKPMTFPALVTYLEQL